MEEIQRKPKLEEKPFTVSIKDETGKVSVSGQEISKPQFSRIIQIIFETEPISSPGSGASLITSNLTESPREYLDSTEAKSYPQKITAVVGYLRDILKRNAVSVDEMKSELEKAGEPVTLNFFRDLKRAVTYGWIARSQQESDKFYVTAKGSKALELKFPIQEKKASSAKKARETRGRSPTITIRQNVRDLQLPTVITGMPTFFSLKTKGERILWILAAAKEGGVESLNHKELSYLADRIGDDIPAKSTSALIEKHKKQGFLSTPLGEDEARNLKILGDGLLFLKGLKKPKE